MMAPPAAPEKEQISNNDSFSSYLAEGAQDLEVPSRRDLRNIRHAWSYRVRDELERELEIEREHRHNYEQRSKKSHLGAAVENGQSELKLVSGQRRKREDDSEEDEATEKRLTKRRNVDVDTGKRPSQPSLNSRQSHASSQPTARPVHAHKFALTDNGPWYESIYNEVYKKVYSEIYDEAYSKAYNLANNDAFKDGYDNGISDGCHDGNNTGYMDGFRRGYKKSYPVLYAEAYEMALDEKRSDGNYEDESGESTVSDEEEESETSETSENFENEK